MADKIPNRGFKCKGFYDFLKFFLRAAVIPVAYASYALDTIAILAEFLAYLSNMLIKCASGSFIVDPPQAVKEVIP